MGGEAPWQCTGAPAAPAAPHPSPRPRHQTRERESLLKDPAQATDWSEQVTAAPLSRSQTADPQTSYCRSKPLKRGLIHHALKATNTHCYPGTAWLVLSSVLRVKK